MRRRQQSGRRAGPDLHGLLEFGVAHVFGHALHGIGLDVLHHALELWVSHQRPRLWVHGQSPQEVWAK